MKDRIGKTPGYARYSGYDTEQEEDEFLEELGPVWCDGDPIREEYGAGGAMRPIDRARALADPTLPRRGRLKTQAKRALVTHSGQASTSQIREWCYVGKPYQHWHHTEIRRALRQLGVKEVGRARGPGRPIILVNRLT